MDRTIYTQHTVGPWLLVKGNIFPKAAVPSGFLFEFSLFVLRLLSHGPCLRAVKDIVIDGTLGRRMALMEMFEGKRDLLWSHGLVLGDTY